MTLLEQRSGKLSKDLVARIARLPGEVSVGSVHHLRTTIRRFESLITYQRPRLTGKQEEALQQLASFRKRAGKVRNLDVQMRLLPAIANGSARTDRRELLQTLGQKRERQARRLAAAVVRVVKKTGNPKLFVRIARIAELAGSAPPQANGDPLDRVKARLRQMAASFDDHKVVKPRQLHKLRIALKGLRYLAELAEDSPEQVRLFNELKQVQDSIGEWHDWSQLARVADKQFGSRMTCPLLVEIQALLAVKYSTALAAANHVLAAWHTSEPGKQPRHAQSVTVLARTA